MRQATGALAAMVLAWGMIGCTACRSTPEDIQKGNTNAAATMRPNQDTAKWDTLIGAAVADSDGDSTNSLQKVGVDVQAPAQATGGAIQFPQLFGNAAAEALAHTSPGEAATLRRLERVQENVRAIETRLADDPTLTPTDRAMLETRLKDATQLEDDLILRLDSYSERKLAAARDLAPNLPSFRQILYFVISNQTAGSEKGQISDAQAESIARVASKAVGLEGDPTAQPETPATPGGGQ